MANKKELDDNTFAFIAVVVAAVIVGVLFAWVYVRQKQQAEQNTSAFASLPTFRFQGESFTVRTTVALQSSPQNAAWIKDNKKTIQKFLETTLVKTQAKQLSSAKPEKIPQLQDSLTAALNKEFPNANIQQVLFTEFLTSPE